MLPKNSVLGDLKISEVYDYYDGPKLFTARNATGTTYLVYWADRSSTGDVWFYTPVSEPRLNSIRNGELPLRQAIRSPEDGIVFRALVPPEGDLEATVEALSPNRIDDTFLPPPDDVLERDDPPVEPAIVAQASRPSGGHELTIGPKKRSFPLIENVGAILSSWSDLLVSTCRNLGFANVRFAPVGTRPGSLIVSIVERNGLESDGPIAVIKECLDHLADAPDVRAVLARASVDPRHLSVFLESIITSGEGLIVSSSSARFDLALPVDRAKAIFDRLRGVIAVAITSDDVPQADRLETVFRVVDLSVAGKELTPDALEVVLRQVNYYRQAARVLGFLDEDNIPTPAGEHLAERDDASRLTIAKSAFQISRCGWAWTRWSHKTTIDDVAPGSSVEFLEASVMGLNATTQRRRGRTLTTWLQAFQTGSL
jgi:hypothetical protein